MPVHVCFLQLHPTRERQTDNIPLLAKNIQVAWFQFTNSSDDNCMTAICVVHNNVTKHDTPVVAEIQSGEVHSKTRQCYWHTGELVVGKI